MATPPENRILVPVDVLGGESVPTTIVEAVASVPIVLLAYHEIPDQTSPEQARTNRGAQASAELEELREVFESAGCDVTPRLVFTHDRFETFERVAVTLDCAAVLVLNPAPKLETMLVAVRGDVTVDRVARLVATVLEGTEIDVTLLHVTAGDESSGEALLETMGRALEECGVERERIDTQVVDGKPTGAILEAAADHDMLVVGESRPSIRRLIFRDRARRIARGSVDPVLVIRGSYQ